MKIICYIPMLEGQYDEVERWMAQMHDRYDILPVLLPPVDWNDDLTPWPAPPIFRKGKAFGGKADAYLQQLENEIVPNTEKALGVVPDERWLVGVSLSGLFAIWASARSKLFSRVASISGSFWYPGFTQWLQGQALSVKQVYISLGDQESQSKNVHLRSIADDTQEVVRTLASQGIPVQFEWTEGTHFAPLVPRLDKALRALLGLSEIKQ